MQKEETEQLELLLRMLKTFNVRNGLGMLFVRKEQELVFFKKDRYLECGKFEGVRVKLEDLVK